MENSYGYPQTRDTRHICQLSDPNCCTPCRKIAEIDGKITTMLKEIIEMETERRLWKVELNAAHDNLTTRLPLEITQMIFQLSLPANATDLCLRYVWDNKQRREIRGPLIISAVSRSWRNIAHSMPKLWANVPLYLHDANKHILPILADEWLKRSGQHPLSIHIDSAKNSKEATELVKLVNRYCSRWMHLSYRGPSSTLSTFSSNIRGISQLQTLTLSVAQSTRRAAGKFDLKHFALRPKRLELDVDSIDRISTDWSYLTDLSLQGISIAESLVVLPKTPRLKTFEYFSSRLMDSSHHVSNRRLLLRNIENLTLGGFHWSVLLTRVICPSLKTLSLRELCSDHLGIQSHVDRILYFTRQSGCSITTLFLYTIHLAEGDLYRMCRDMPTLQRLDLSEINCPDIASSLLALLAEPSNAGADVEPLYLPELRSLYIQQKESFKWTLLPPIFYVPQSPVRRRCRLQTISIRILPYEPLSTIPAPLISNMTIGDEVKAQLMTLNAEGKQLSVQLGHGTGNLI